MKKLAIALTAIATVFFVLFTGFAYSACFTPGSDPYGDAACLSLFMTAVFGFGAGGSWATWFDNQERDRRRQGYM